MSKNQFDISQLPAVVQQRAASLGTKGQAWLRKLPDTVHTLTTRWQVRLIQVLTGGSESLVTLVIDTQGNKAVMKIGLPGSADLTVEAAIYRLADGRGYARLLAEAAEYNALLLEHLGTPLASHGLPTTTQIEVICRTLQTAWRPLTTIPPEADAEGDLPAGVKFMTAAAKTAWLENFIRAQWHGDGHPCSAEAVDQALRFCAERAAAFSPATAVLVHGDAHSHNTLAAHKVPDDGPDHGAIDQYKFIDPEGLHAEPACDLAALMRDWNEELLSGPTVKLAIRRCHLLADLCGVAPEPIWQWGNIERVSTALTLMQLGMQDEADIWLQVCNRLAEVDTPD